MQFKFFKAASCGLIIGFACTSASGGVIFSDGFEQYSTAGFGTAQEGWRIVNSPIRSGNYAISDTLQTTAATKAQPSVNFEVAARHKHKHKHKHKSHKHNGGTSKHSVGGKGRARSESTLGKKGHLQRGRYYTIHFSNRVAGDTGKGAIVFQIHKVRGKADHTGHQPIQLHSRGGHWVVSVHSNSSKGRHFDLGPIDKSRYTDWTFRVKLSSGKDGDLEVTKNGKHVLSYRGPNDFNGKGDPYVKFGIYRPKKVYRGSSGKQTVYYDQVQLSSN